MFTDLVRAATLPTLEHYKWIVDQAIADRVQWVVVPIIVTLPVPLPVRADNSPQFVCRSNDGVLYGRFAGGWQVMGKHDTLSYRLHHAVATLLNNSVACFEYADMTQMNLRHGMYITQTN